MKFSASSIFTLSSLFVSSLAASTVSASQRKPVSEKRVVRNRGQDTGAMST